MNIPKCHMCGQEKHVMYWYSNKSILTCFNDGCSVYRNPHSTEFFKDETGKVWANYQAARLHGYTPKKSKEMEAVII